MDKKRCFNFHLAPAMHGAPINFVPGHNGKWNMYLRLHSARLIPVLVGLAACAAIASPSTSDIDQEHWVGAWSAAPTQASTQVQYTNQTLRLIAHTSIGGTRTRVRISNTFGTETLFIGAAHVAIRNTGASIVPDTDRALSFSGRSSFAVPVGGLVLSDPVDLDVAPRTDLAVSIYLPELSTGDTTHVRGQQNNYVSQMPGDFTAALDLPNPAVIARWDFLTGVDVDTWSGTAIVAFGESMTAGVGSTPDTNRRWPDFLEQRLLQNHFKRVAVLNEGLPGNRILYPGPPKAIFFGPSALARFDRDVLGQAGLKYVIVLLGGNDIVQPGANAPVSEEVSADDVIAGHLQLITRAHERGILIYGGTTPPNENSTLFPWTLEHEAKREAVNEWIRTSGAYDAVIDFDDVLRDPTHPQRLLPAFDSGDHTHPNDAGHNAMANAIDLNLFRADSR
jgi:lysophospholipase L1-like esterase